MLNDKKVSVVIPCFNEATQIQKVVETLPSFVDMVVVIDDCSTDSTVDAVKSLMKNPKLKLTITNDRITPKNSLAGLLDEKLFHPSTLIHEENSKIFLAKHIINGGKGAAISTGYRYARLYDMDCVVIMDGDGQMDPSELESLCLPIVKNEAEFCKGNRLKYPQAISLIPKVRFWGNSVLSILTKIASGYWKVSDTQTGYVAISKSALDSIQIAKIYKSYGMPNDLLVKLNIVSARINEIPIRPVYNVGEKSKMKIHKVIPLISFLLVKLFFYRLLKKYLLNDFHPLFLMYFAGFVSFIINIPIIFNFLINYFNGNIMYGHLTVMTFLFLFSFQSLVFAMWFDMQDNQRLYV